MRVVGEPSTWHHGGAVVSLLTVGLALAGCAPSVGLPPPALAQRLPDQPDDALGVGGGRLSDPVSPFDTGSPAIANLDPALLAAVQQAAEAAVDDGVTILVTSGWRSAAFQQSLLDEAVTRYGSEAEALRYVASPDASRHVSGDAVDVGPTDAADWLGRHGADVGLCQTYANEMWHFELTTAPGTPCPAMLEDATRG